ncbi:hypothetical protein SBADM41S_08908 [Streptomyces badius]
MSRRASSSRPALRSDTARLFAALSVVGKVRPIVSLKLLYVVLSSPTESSYRPTSRRSRARFMAEDRL